MRTINLCLLLLLSSSLVASAQENRKTESQPVTVEVIAQEKAANAKDVSVQGNFTPVSLPFRRIPRISSQEGWVQQSPPPIGKTLNDVHVFNATTALVIGNRGTIYKTTDQGENWTKIASGTTRNLYAMFFPDANNGWIVGSSGAVLKTTDGGDSWQYEDTDLPSLKDVYFSDATNGFAISSSKIFKTTDGGATWVQKFKAPEVTYFLESLAFADANTGIAIGSLSKMYRTTDAGETWELVEAGSVVWKYNVQFVDASHGWIAGLQASRIKITVGGGLFGGGTDIEIDNPRYALWQTADGGATWTQLNFPYAGRFYGVYFRNATEGWAVGTHGAVFHTQDGGSNWTVTQSVHDMNAVHFADAESGWAVGEEGTILQTSNGGDIWALQSGNGTTRDLYAAYFIDPQTGWVAGERGKMLHTTNGGALWFEQNVGTTSKIESMFFLDDQKGYVVFGWYPYIRYTIDGGNNWKNLSGPPPSFDGLNGIFFVDNQNGWFVGKRGDIWHTSNGGTRWSNWQEQISNTTEDLNAVHFVDPAEGWTVGDNGTILHTQDGGSTWSLQGEELDISVDLTAVHFTDPMHGFIVGQFGRMFLTTDGGANWEMKVVDEHTLYDISFIDDQTGWITGSKGTILKTEDGGATWGLQKSGTDRSLYAVHFVDPQSGFVVGADGTILNTAAGGGAIYYPPVLTSPSDGATGVSTSPVLSWSPVGGVISYRVQVSTNTSFYRPLIDQEGVTDASFRVSGLKNSTRYYWRVKAIYAETESNWSYVWHFVTKIIPPPAPALSSPADGAVEQPTSLRLDWNYVREANRYHLQLATDPAFTTIVVDDSSVINSSMQVDSLTINTTYYWRVRAKNDFIYGAWSGVWRFTTISGPPAAPVLSWPEDRARNQKTTLTLRWDAAAGAERYHLQVAVDSLFTALAFEDSSLRYTSKQLEALAVNTTYYWRVRAQNQLGASPWSGIRRFSTISGAPPAPALSRPSDDARNQPTTLTLRWKSSEGAENYHLQVASDSLFSALAFEDSSVHYTSKRVEALAVNTTYYWRVRAKNAIGAGPWSAVWKFSTVSAVPPAPLLSRPRDGATNQPTNIYLNWKPSEGAEYYHLQVAKDSLFLQKVINDSTINYSGSDVHGLASNTTYYWRVRAMNAVGEGPWSSVWSFSTVSAVPAAPQLSRPYNGATNQPTTVDLDWRSTEGAEFYHLQVATDSLFTHKVVDDSTIEYSGQDIEGLASNTTYYWRVRAINALGAGPWSVVWSFTTITGVPAAPRLSSPDNGAEHQPTNLDLLWYEQDGAETYHLQVSTDSAFTNIVFEDAGIRYPDAEVESLAINTIYYWRVRALNALGAGPWSEVWRFKTVSSAPARPVLSEPEEGAGFQALTLYLDWEKSEGAQTYHLQVATDSLFTAMVFEDSTIEYTFERIGPLAINTTYYWRVRAKNVLGVSPWSAIWHFSTYSSAPPTPVLYRPENGAKHQPPRVYLNWIETPGAETYRLQVALDSLFKATVFDDSTLDYDLKRIGPLALNTTYYWRVQAKNTLGISPWSDTWHFSTIAGAPHAVELIAPADREVLSASSVNFRWRRSVPDVFRYWFELAADSSMQNLIVVDSTLSPIDTTMTVNPLQDQGNYWWRVKAKNILGWGAFSEKRQFHIDRTTGVQTSGGTPREFALAQNFPNPFNPETTIRYQLPQAAEVKLEIYNLLGQRVATLVEQKQPAGYYSVTWDGRDQYGQQVASGVYVYRLQAGEFVQIRKMTLLR